jgi:hypothetical protein
MGGGSTVTADWISAGLAAMINATVARAAKRKLPLKPRQLDPLYLFQHVVNRPASAAIIGALPA